MHRYSWHVSPAVVERAEAAMASGEYAGIGELHLTPGVRGGRDNPILHRLIVLALQYDRPFLLHTETTDPQFLRPLCQRYPRLKLVWAHAGGNMPLAGVVSNMEACPNLVADLSARDRWRYVDDPIVDGEGHLQPGWRAVILRWPERFMIGADALWPVDQKHRWDVADSGWLRVHDFLQFHRRWLQELPASVAQKISHDNALRVYGS
jgi:predicted TIM-barrel fold metal-dependent hydrolase